MTTKKILGYLFSLLAILLAVTFMGMLPKMLGTLAGLVRVFMGKSDSYQFGVVLGELLFWVALAALAVWLWKVGRKWAKSEN